MKNILILFALTIVFLGGCKKETETDCSVKVEISASGEIRTDIEINTEMKSYFNNDKITLYIDDYDSINVFTYYLNPSQTEITQKIYVNGDLKKTDTGIGSCNSKIRK